MKPLTLLTILTLLLLMVDSVSASALSARALQEQIVEEDTDEESPLWFTGYCERSDFNRIIFTGLLLTVYLPFFLLTTPTCILDILLLKEERSPWCEPFWFPDCS